MAPARRPGRAFAVAVGAVVAVWVVAALGPLAFLMPVIPVALWARRRRGAAVICVLLSPLVVVFVLGVVSYCLGDAYLWGAGLPGTQFYNLDRELRCGHATSGCLVSGNEWVRHGPNNVAVRLMTRWFGPQRGTYTGPYPTEAEAVAAVADAPGVPVAQVLADSITVGDRVVRLDRGVGAGLLRAGRYFPELMSPDEAQAVLFGGEAGPIRAAVWRDSCLVLRVPTSALNDPEAPVQSACIAVCDVATGRPFAYYAQGDYYHRVPPVMWRR